jgi:hypothetical protein
MPDSTAQPQAGGRGFPPSTERRQRCRGRADRRPTVESLSANMRSNNSARTPNRPPQPPTARPPQRQDRRRNAQPPPEFPRKKPLKALGKEPARAGIPPLKKHPPTAGEKGSFWGVKKVVRRPRPRAFGTYKTRFFVGSSRFSSFFAVSPLPGALHLA